MTQLDRNTSSAGLVLHSAAGYDFVVWLMTLRWERHWREKLLGLARLQPDESVLDVGCGTGTLAIAAKRCGGPDGIVHGVDASPEMIARARKKARKAGVEIDFRQALVQSLPFPPGQFDLVLSTVMLHHLPRKARQECALEMRRVLKPGGRVLVVDFGAPDPRKHGLLAHFHRHGHVKLDDVITLMDVAGLKVVNSGPVGVGTLQFVLAAAP